VGFGGGEAFVPHVDGEAEVFAELGGESFGFGGLRAAISGGVEGEADDDFCEGAEAEEAIEVAEVVAAAGAGEGGDGLGDGAEFVGDGDADAAVADVEAEDADCGGTCRVGGVGGHGAIVLRVTSRRARAKGSFRMNLLKTTAPFRSAGRR